MKKNLLLVIACGISFLLQAQISPQRDKSTKLYGYINKQKEWVVEPRFTDAKKFEKGYAKVVLNGFVGLINEEGKVIVEPEKYVGIEPFEGDYAKVHILLDTGRGTKKDYFGLINKEGKEVAQPLHSKITFHDEYAIGTGFEAAVYKPAAGEVVFAPGEYESYQYMDSEKIFARKNYLWGIVRLNDKSIVLEPQFSKVPTLKDGFYFTEKGLLAKDVKTFGLMSAEGKMLLENKYVFLIFDQETSWFFASEADNKWSVYDKNLAPLKTIEGYNLERKNAAYFNEERCMVSKTEGETKKFGFIDQNFNLVIPIQYDTCSIGFANGFCGVKDGEGWTFIDKSGKNVTDKRFSRIGSGFKNTDGKLLATVYSNNDKFLLSPDGSITKAEVAKPSAPAQSTDHTWLLGRWKVEEEGMMGKTLTGNSLTYIDFSFTSLNSVTIKKYEDKTMGTTGQKTYTYSITGNTINISGFNQGVFDVSADKRTMILKGPLGISWKLVKL